MRELLIPVCLLILGLVLTALEAFVPSGGLLGIMALLSYVVAIIYAFVAGGLQVGSLFFAFTLAIVSVLIWQLVKLWPKTSLGKKILVEPPKIDSANSFIAKLRSLEGRFGRVQTLMVPGGSVEIDGRLYDAIGETTIEANTWVKVVGIRNRNLLVRPVDEGAVEDFVVEPEDGEDPTSADDLLLDDPFDDRLA